MSKRLDNLSVEDEVLVKGDAEGNLTRFDATKTYKEGNYVFHSNSIYRCKETYDTAGEWDTVSSHFEFAVNVEDVVHLTSAEDIPTAQDPAFITELNKLAGVSATSIEDGKVVGGMRYYISLNKASDTLNITEIEDSKYETVIFLSIGPSVIVDPIVTFPSGYKSIGDISYTSGNNYVISIQNGIVVGAKVTTNE